MFRCLACRQEVEADDVAIRLTDHPDDRRVLCVWCRNLDERQPIKIREAARVDVSAALWKA
jgi:hypothetical protein